LGVFQGECEGEARKDWCFFINLQGSASPVRSASLSVCSRSQFVNFDARGLANPLPNWPFLATGSLPQAVPRMRVRASPDEPRECPLRYSPPSTPRTPSASSESGGHAPWRRAAGCDRSSGSSSPTCDARCSVCDNESPAAGVCAASADARRTVSESDPRSPRRTAVDCARRQIVSRHARGFVLQKGIEDFVAG